MFRLCARMRSHQPRKSGKSCLQKWANAAKRSAGAAGSRITWISRRKLSFSTTNLGLEVEAMIVKREVQGSRFNASPEGKDLLLTDPSKLRMRETRTLNA